MPNSLAFILYSSMASSAHATPDDLQILIEATRFNRDHHITGFLLRERDRFFQILEGDELILGDLYSRIRRDPRHRRVTTLLQDRLAERRFSIWDMGYSISAAVPLTGPVGEPADTIGPEQPEHMINVLHGVAERQRLRLDQPVFAIAAPRDGGNTPRD